MLNAERPLKVVKNICSAGYCAIAVLNNPYRILQRADSNRMPNELSSVQRLTNPARLTRVLV